MKTKPYNFKVYVACSLTHATQEFRDEVENFKDKLDSYCDVLRFLGLVDVSAYEVYRFDIWECVHKSDLVVAICDHPSIGLGYEMATQIEARKMPCLAIAHEKAKVTDLILDTRQPGYELKRYKILHEDGLEIVVEKLKELQKIKKERRILQKTA